MPMEDDEDVLEQVLDLRWARAEPLQEDEEVVELAIERVEAIAFWRPGRDLPAGPSADTPSRDTVRSGPT